MTKLDFAGLNSVLLSSAPSVCMDILPGGRIEGHEYVCASIVGGRGKSFKVNIKTGVWADFANPAYSGGDLISLYAAARGVSMGDAFRALADQYNHIDTSAQRLPAPTTEHPCRVAPADAPDPSMHHNKYGSPSSHWVYRDANGGRFFFIARYDTDDGKQFVPWTYRDGRWTPKSWTHPRPIYRIDALTVHADRHILICEGEKSADAAQLIVGDAYVCTTWAGGSRAVSTADWSILRGRNVLIWPDADEPGQAACDSMIGILQRSGVNEIKTINTHGMPQGWDAADSGFSTADFFAWAQPRIQVVGDTTPIVSERETATVDSIPRPVVGIDIDPQTVSGSSIVMWSRLGIQTNSNGQPVVNADTVRRIVDGIPELRGHIWGDEFYRSIRTDIGGNGPRAWTDADKHLLLNFCQRQLNLQKMSDATFALGIRTVAAFDIRNEPRDWLNSLVWDGTPRLDTFLSTYFGTPNTPYHTSAGRNWWIGIIARMLTPGCQMDNQIIFKGTQGCGKTSALRIIGGKWYLSAGRDVLSKDFYQRIQGKVIVEIGELVGYSRADIESVKDCMSNSVDNFRVPYAEFPADNPRTCVFAATTNEETPLRDPTGSRRFWCVDCGFVDTQNIFRDRDQFFAEAKNLFSAWQETVTDSNPTGDPKLGWWLMPAEETAAIAEQNRDTDPWEEIVHEWLEGRYETTSVECLENCIKMDAEKITKSHQMRIGNCIKSAGWEKVERWRGNRSVKIWVKNRFSTISTCDDLDF